MTTTSESKATRPVPVRRRRPTPGERNRGAVDALQTKIAVNLQNLDSATFTSQLEANIKELPDATGCDAAFLALFTPDLSGIEAVIATSNVFSACNAEPLTGESLSDWPWLCQHLGHLKVIEINDTSGRPDRGA